MEFASSLLLHPKGVTIGGTGGFDNNSNNNNNNVPADGGNNNNEDIQNQFTGAVGDANKLAGGVKDAWICLARAVSEPSQVTASAASDASTTAGMGYGMGMGGGGPMMASNSKAKDSGQDHHNNGGVECKFNNGQMSKAVRTAALGCTLHQCHTVSQQLMTTARGSSDSVVDQDRSKLQELMEQLTGTSTTTQESPITVPELMHMFYERLWSIREYNAKHPSSAQQQANANGEDEFNYQPNEDFALPFAKKRKTKVYGSPAADGYNLQSLLQTKVIHQLLDEGNVFSGEEVLGKYLDLTSSHATLLNLVLLLQSTTSTDEEKKESDEPTITLSYVDYLACLNGSGGASAEMITSGTNTNNVNNASSSTSTIRRGFSSLLPVSFKLQHRKKYLTFLTEVYSYLVGYLKRTQPFVHVNLAKEVLGPAHEELAAEWKRCGGFVPQFAGAGASVSAWEEKAGERDLADTLPSFLFKASITEEQANNEGGDSSKAVATSNEIKKESDEFDLAPYNTAEELLAAVSPDVLKVELSKRGMKCGGMPKQRAERLFATKSKSLEELPAKWFVNKAMRGGGGGGNASSVAKGPSGTNPTDTDPAGPVPSAAALLCGGERQRRIDIAYLEHLTNALLRQLKPTLDSTLRRAERRLTQTLPEREREVEEEIAGSGTGGGDDDDMDMDGNKRNKDGEDGDSSDDEDAPIYNPKGVPLGWDGKPIPYWLFKLHGLNHFYTCEICGNETYRGRKHFETHFAESKHAYGMKSLGIPNTTHFHGVTKMKDAMDLWQQLQEQIEREVFDGTTQEEYEDSHGNVLSRAKYEDLARQGLL
jgi:hypothetical protein